MSYKVKCIALDLDRTTIDRTGRIPPENRAALLEAIAEGVTVIVASGRPYGALPADVLCMPGIGYAITGNGCAVCRMTDGLRIRESYLPEAAVKHILKRCEQENIRYECFIGGASYCDAAYWRDPVGFGSSPNAVPYIQSTRKPVEHMERFILENRSCLDALDVITRNREERDRIWRMLGETVPDIYLTSSADQLLEISSSESGKGQALRWLLGEFGIDPGETAAFGDGDNDADMLSSVGFGIAVGNATPACKAAAAFVTDDFDAAGVAKAIENYLK